MVSAPQTKDDEIQYLERDAELPSQENAKKFRCILYAVSHLAILAQSLLSSGKYSTEFG